MVALVTRNPLNRRQTDPPLEITLFFEEKKYNILNKIKIKYLRLDLSGLNVLVIDHLLIELMSSLT